MIEQARAAVMKGQSLADAPKALDLRDIKARFVAGGGPARSRAWDDFFVEEAFERAYQGGAGEAGARMTGARRGRARQR